MALSNFLKRLAGHDQDSGIHLDVKSSPPRDSAPGTGQAAPSGTPGKDRRKSLRVSVKGLEARVCGKNRSLPVRDLSVTGAGLAFQGKRVKGGTTFRVDLAVGESVYAEGVKAKVVRHDQGILGVIWLELNRQQDDGLHKIVLEAQKRQAALRKKQGKPPV